MADSFPMKAFRNLRVIGLLLLLVVVIGTAGYHFIEGWPWFDGFYRVVTTLTTIGYQEVHPLWHAGRVFNVFIILAGVSLVLLGIGARSQALLEFELQSSFGKRRLEREIGRPDSHCIICGMGRVGRSLARELAGKPVPFVIRENSDAKREWYAFENWLVVSGDATQEQTLRQAQIDRARGLIAATTTDATNLYIVLTARGLNPHLKIIARASEDNIEKHSLTAGADSLVSPHSFAGQRIAQSLRPHVVSFLDSATPHLGMSLEIGEIHITPQSAFAGKTLEGFLIRQERGVIVLAIKRRQRTHFNPAPDERIEPDDCLMARGEPTPLRQLEQTAASL